MKKIIRAAMLVLALTATAYAGDMQNDKTSSLPPPPRAAMTQSNLGDMQNDVTGDMQNDVTDLAAAIAMNLFQTVLTLF
ncbi:MAG: hypothetical protein ACRD9R_02005 [Pyrinomonadaceae bacterium]